MKLYLDTADITAWHECSLTSAIDGVTTNPALVAGCNKSYETVLSEFSGVIDGPIFAQVTARTASAMIEQANRYHEIHSSAIIKLPATEAGFTTLAELREKPISAGITVCFTASQAILAGKLDASFIAPYVGRMNDNGQDAVQIVKQILDIYDAHEFDTEVLAASLRNATDATELSAAGVDAITLSPSVYESYFHHPQTTASVAEFHQIWEDFHDNADQ
ncbi:MAG: transaldolase [Haloquadratum sp. J07HQX50]|jgi:Transaldolase|nr:MAG: transaldolase [Haloquadratum sp. J07HQX50]